MKHPRGSQHIAQCQRVAVIQMLGVFPQFGARFQTQRQFARRNPCFDFFQCRGHCIHIIMIDERLQPRHFLFPHVPAFFLQRCLRTRPILRFRECPQFFSARRVFPRTARAPLPRSTRPAQSSSQAESAKSTPRSSFTTPPSAAAAPDASAPASAPSPAPAAFPACSGTAAARPARPQTPARESAPSAS